MAFETDRREEPEVTPDEFSEGFGEPIRRALDVETWQTGEDLAEVYRRIDEEVRDAVRTEEQYCRLIRESIFPQLDAYDGAPTGAGVYRAQPVDLERVHRGLLFNGGVEA